jgi:hypothetical protein
MAGRGSSWKELAEQDRERMVQFFWSDISDDLGWSREVGMTAEDMRHRYRQS